MLSIIIMKYCRVYKEINMQLDTQKVRKLYSGMLANHYDLPISHFFGKYKALAFHESSLKPGDTVLVFCCGTGLDFPGILEKIGSKGRIVGVDFSSEMLKKAQKKVDKHNWKNVELVEADVTTYTDNTTYDCGVCTLGISIIPEYKKAYKNLLAHVKPQGELIIGDMQLASGWLARFNPVTIFMAKRYGGTQKGHQNSMELCSIMQTDLADTRKREFFLKSYFYCIGVKK
jgi:demethylmenaquinone methyltransferase/2-methoxy-6-polyprenyl-1,4-benzoquinol methylase